MSENHKMKISIANKGQKRTNPEYFAKMSSIRKGKKFNLNEEQRKKLRIRARGKRKTNNKYIGVRCCVNRTCTTYQAMITINKKLTNLGFFKSEEEAALVRDKKAIELYGEEAVLNFPIKNN